MGLDDGVGRHARVVGEKQEQALVADEVVHHAAQEIRGGGGLPQPGRRHAAEGEESLGVLRVAADER